MPQHSNLQSHQCSWTKWISTEYEQVNSAVTLPARWLLTSAGTPIILAEVFRGFLQSMQTNPRIVPWKRSRPFPSPSLPVHHSRILVPFDTMKCKLLKASLNKSAQKFSVWICYLGPWDSAFWLQLHFPTQIIDYIKYSNCKTSSRFHCGRDPQGPAHCRKVLIWKYSNFDENGKAWRELSTTSEKSSPLSLSAVYTSIWRPPCTSNFVPAGRSYTGQDPQHETFRDLDKFMFSKVNKI
jgi:hypothetical protein